MHAQTSTVSFETLLQIAPAKVTPSARTLTWIFLAIGVISAIVLFTTAEPKIAWGIYWVNVVFWTGLAAGSCIIPAIVQITGAKWAPPVRRLAEANVSFLPVAFVLFCVSYLGRKQLFFWGDHPMPGREWWMQPNFVYLRIGGMLALLFFLMHRFVRMSLRSDIGLLREKSPNKSAWLKPQYDGISQDWNGSEREVGKLHAKLSWNAPLLIAVYALAYSFFVFEMVMGMDPEYVSNLYGAFIFIGNIYIGWACLGLSSIAVAKRDPAFAKILKTQQLWDLGKLTFGFCMLWGYMFFSQFLPYWYANVPETSQWTILRMREFPWMPLGYVTFGMAFVIPFILLLSDDFKRNPLTYTIVSLILVTGVWLDKYMVIMPEMSPDRIPFGIWDIGITLGFFGLYRWRRAAFLDKYPYVPVANMMIIQDTH